MTGKITTIEQSSGTWIAKSEDHPQIIGRGTNEANAEADFYNKLFKFEETQQDLDVNELVSGLQTAGLNPIVIDEMTAPGRVIHMDVKQSLSDDAKGDS